MHKSAYNIGKLLFTNYWTADCKTILDIGAMDVNGSLRDLAPAKAIYTGIDLEHGKGVDQVLSDPYSYPFPDNSFDMIVSTSCFEHDPMFWATFLEASRVLADGGILYINAPSSGAYHAYPWDNWRFYPDASIALEMWAKRNHLDIRAVESFTHTRCGEWNDYVMVFTKGGSRLENNTNIKFLSMECPDAINIRRATNPGEMLNLSTSNTDVARAVKVRLGKRFVNMLRKLVGK